MIQHILSANGVAIIWGAVPNNNGKENSINNDEGSDDFAYEIIPLRTIDIQRERAARPSLVDIDGLQQPSFISHDRSSHFNCV